MAKGTWSAAKPDSPIFKSKGKWIDAGPDDPIFKGEFVISSHNKTPQEKVDKPEQEEEYRPSNLSSTISKIKTEPVVGRTLILPSRS